MIPGWKKKPSYSDELKFLEFWLKIVQAIQNVSHTFLFFGSLGPSLQTYFYYVRSGQNEGVKWQTKRNEQCMKKKYSTDWMKWITYWRRSSLAIHSQLLFSFILLKYRIRASCYSNDLNAGRGISESTTKLIYAKLWISSAKSGN